MRKDYVLYTKIPNIVPLTAVATESAYYGNVNTTPQFARNVLMKLLSQTTESSVIYPVVIIKINNIKCCALSDTSSGGSYVSEAIIDLFKINPIIREHKAM